MGDENTVLEKIRKLLAKANDNPFPEEAQAAILKAQKLLIKSGLSIEDVDINPRNSVVLEGITNYTRIPWWQDWLSAVIAQNFRCYAWKKVLQGKSRIVFLGKKDDVETAKRVFYFAMDAIKYHSKNYVLRVRDAGRQTRGIKNDYIKGFLIGMQEKFRKQVENQNWELVLIKDPVVDIEYEKYNLRKGRVNQILTAGNKQAKTQGYRQGKAFIPATRRIDCE